MSSLSGNRGFRGSTGQNQGEIIPEGYSKGRVANFTPEQMEMLKQSMSRLGPDSFLSKLAGGDPSMFQEMEAPAMRQFNELQGNISSRFSGMGSGARRSSGFQNTMTSASSNFAQDLQSRRQDLMRQATKDLHGMSSDLLGQKPFENFLTPEKQPFWQQLLSGLSGGAGQFLGNKFGGLGSGSSNR